MPGVHCPVTRRQPSSLRLFPSRQHARTAGANPHHLNTHAAHGTGRRRRELNMPGDEDHDSELHRRRVRKHDFLLLLFFALLFLFNSLDKTIASLRAAPTGSRATKQTKKRATAVFTSGFSSPTSDVKCADSAFPTCRLRQSSVDVRMQSWG